MTKRPSLWSWRLILSLGGMRTLKPSPERKQPCAHERQPDPSSTQGHQYHLCEYLVIAPLQTTTALDPDLALCLRLQDRPPQSETIVYTHTVTLGNIQSQTNMSASSRPTPTTGTPDDQIPEGPKNVYYLGVRTWQNPRSQQANE